ncbi:hypothetical protein R1sor_023306 [Riccia sorocarpa]|uniref:F-box domain-containing protein n=1 Tax=Riccia sorocarpa TaxID=122646 RepID=A0ABD3GQL1_9MARC
MRGPEQGRSNAEDRQLESSGYFHSLPDELALRCLVRVPRRYHSAMAAVCRHWRDAVRSTVFWNLRKEMGLSEGWLYALMRDNSEFLHWFVMDPAKRTWKPLPPLPGESARRYGMGCEVLDRELFIVGGGVRFKPPVANVLKYDPISNTWKTSTPLESPRQYFASAVFNGKLYAVGGMGTTFDSLHSFDVYDPNTETWSTFADANIVSDLGEALILNAVTDSGDVYMLDQTYGLKIMTLKQGTVEWKAVGRLSPKSIQPPCKMAIIKNYLYIVGRGLKTIVYNLDRGDDGRGMLVTSSIRPMDISEHVILSCNVIEI